VKPAVYGGPVGEMVDFESGYDFDLGNGLDYGYGYGYDFDFDCETDYDWMKRIPDGEVDVHGHMEYV